MEVWSVSGLDADVRRSSTQMRPLRHSHLRGMGLQNGVQLFTGCSPRMCRYKSFTFNEHLFVISIDRESGILKARSSKAGPIQYLPVRVQILAAPKSQRKQTACHR